MSQQYRLGTVHTTVSTINGITNVTYHNTVVVSFNAKKIILNNGGWQTATTKTRMNQSSNQFDLGYTVTQENYNWFVMYNGKKRPFENGMILDRCAA
jgi:hypothetical protein